MEALSWQRKIKQPKAIILSLVLLILLAGASYLIYHISFSLTSESKLSITEGVAAKRDLNFSANFDKSILQEKFFFNSQKINISELTQPIEGIATDKDNPAPPQEITVKNLGDGQRLLITWQLPPACADCQVAIYRSLESSEERQLIADNITKKYYLDYQVEHKQIYYYQLRTITTKEAKSNYSIAVKAIPFDYLPPMAPENVQAVDLENGKGIKLTWSIPEDDDFDHIKIFRSDTKGEKGEVLVESVNTSSITDTTALPNKIYYYTLVSVDQANNGSLAIIVTTSGRTNPFLIPPL